MFESHIPGNNDSVYSRLMLCILTKLNHPDALRHYFAPDNIYQAVIVRAVKLGSVAVVQVFAQGPNDEQTAVIASWRDPGARSFGSIVLGHSGLKPPEQAFGAEYGWLQPIASEDWIARGGVPRAIEAVPGNGVKLQTIDRLTQIIPFAVTSRKLSEIAINHIATTWGR